MDDTLRGRDFLRELDFTAEEFQRLIDLAAELKLARRERREQQQLSGKVIALVFEKTSTRTRASFEVAAYHQGAHATYIDPQSSQFGHKESVSDTARVLSRFYDGIQYRGASQHVVDELAEYADVPVWNGLTDEWHPTQMLADFLTMQEATGRPASEISYAYLGDARYNMGNSLLVTGAILGSDVRIAAPRELWPSVDVQAAATAQAAESDARLTLTEDIDAAVAGVDFVITDVWVSMGEPKSVWDERIELLRPYRVDSTVMAKTQNAEAKFLHCLPAYHDTLTGIGRDIAERNGLTDGVEVTDEVFNSAANLAFDEAENRMHTIKALLVATLRD
jgi:ornithine carbamoyltransferase